MHKTLIVGIALMLGCGDRSLGATASDTDDGSDASADEGADTSDGSCAELASNCGAAGNESCCASPLVPGGTFFRSYDGVTEFYTSQAYPATVSDFRLDKYPISVGRFRGFVAAYAAWRGAGHPEAGEGAHPLIEGTGWDPTWDGNLAGSADALVADVKSCGSPAYQTWTDASADNETLPMNCLTWFEAFAFCAWDGGRLPTEAEYNYAAAGGSEQRVYPWGSTVPGADADLVNHACWYNGSGPGSCTGVENIAPVGRVSAGDGKYGQADLEGNLAAYVFDWYAELETPCIDCARIVAPTDVPYVIGRVLKGNGFLYPARVGSARTPLDDNGEPLGGFGPDYRDYDTGSRCARAPE